MTFGYNGGIVSNMNSIVVGVVTIILIFFFVCLWLNYREKIKQQNIPLKDYTGKKEEVKKMSSEQETEENEKEETAKEENNDF